MRGEGLRILAFVLLVGNMVLANAAPGAGHRGTGSLVPPRSLVARMLDAHENFKAPAKEMRFETDGGADFAKWPFDVARIEGLLEKGLVRGADGVYRLRRNASEDPRKAAEAALAYVNNVVSDWAVLQLDAKYPRADVDVLHALAAYRVDMEPGFWNEIAAVAEKGAFAGAPDKKGGWVAAWRISEKLYLVVTADFRNPLRPREYQFVMWDGKKDWPIAGFDEFPDAVRALTVMRLIEIPAAANNLVALIHARDANRRLFIPEYAESLLRRAAAGGSETAFHNLGVLMEEMGDREQAEAFFSREKTEPGK